MRFAFALTALLLIVTFFAAPTARAVDDRAGANRASESHAGRDGAGEDRPETTTAAIADRVARGEYLARIGLCHDCHTPHVPGPKGPEPDMTRALSGHPSDIVIAELPAMKGPWVFAGGGTFTAWGGPWGVSFTANLTPDKETGLGKWTEDMFFRALRTGRHEGNGRPILPPMPYQYIGSMTDEDLRSLFAYLQSIPAVHNRVPKPIDPPEEEGQ